MKIGVFVPAGIPFSARNYVDNISRELRSKGVECEFFYQESDIPKPVDILWDPRSMGGAATYKQFVKSKKPLVVTIHGASPFSMSYREYYLGLKSAIRGQFFKLKNKYDWLRFRNYCAAFIAVSEYGKWEVANYLKLNEKIIYPIWHGVDFDKFYPGECSEKKPYLLHVSQYQPKKNVDRILEAYAKLPIKNKPKLVAVVPGYPKLMNVPEGVEIIRKSKPHRELADLYRGAIGFVFPSLHETFGMPIVEAMASGCPVITSNITACSEVAGDAALLVNPRATDEIAGAMIRLIDDDRLRKKLRKKGIERARLFTWQKSAERHIDVFSKIILGAYKNERT